MCNGHARCTKYPVYRVVVHRFDFCNKPPGPDAVHFLCPDCTAYTAGYIGRLIGELYSDQSDSRAGQEIRCKCGRRVMYLHDLFTVEWAEARTA